MDKLKEIFAKTFILLALTFFSSQSFGFEAWWQCSSRQGGDWSFGRAPSICLVDHMQTQSSVNSQYSPILFSDTSERTPERRRYITELNAVAKEMAQYYLNRRKPSASASEVAAFSKGLLALMHQETVWSHYRKSTDGRVRYMRGDVGHGHGLMQVDDRSHQTALLQGKGADLVKNMIYGLDVFYAQWQRAPSQSCVNGSTDYTNRIRSAWAAYNGGPGRICRWTKTTGTFAHHDKDFYEKLKNQSWKNYVTTENKKTSLNLSCLVEGTRPCANNETPGPIPTTPDIGELYQLGSGLYCLYGSDNKLHCLDQLNDVNCLELSNDRKYPSRGILSEEQVKDKQIVRLDRNALCKDEVLGLYGISNQIQLKKRINIRKTPGGELVGTASLDFETPILDFQITSSDSQSRYYKINFQGQSGYIYAGDQSDFESWAVLIEDSVVSPLVASPGEHIRITAPNGINMRNTPGGQLLVRVPKSSLVKVMDRVVQGDQNYLYYKITFDNKVGYIYSGFLNSEDSISSWTQIEFVNPGLALKPQINFRFLKSCPEADCEFSSSVLKSQTSQDQVKVLEQKNNWSKVSTFDNAKTGWIRSNELENAN